MNFFLTTLTGFVLLGQPHYAGAQPRASGLENLDQLFSYVTRSSAENRSTLPKPAIKLAEVNKEVLKLYCEKIVKDGQRIYYLSNRNGRMRLQLRGVYTRGSTLFFLLRLRNRSPLDYDVDSIRFFMADGSGQKKPLSRLNELSPVYIYDSTVLVRGYGQANSVIVLPRFTLPRGWQLLIEVREKNGGRHLQIQATNFVLERARLI